MDERLQPVSNVVYSLTVAMLFIPVIVPAVGCFQLSVLVPAILTVFILAAPGGFSFKARYICILFMLFCISLQSMRVIESRMEIQIPADMKTVKYIEGTLAYDSSFSAKGSTLFTLRLSGIENSYGNRFSASGVVTVTGKDRSVMSAGTKIRFYGKFSGNLFYFSSLQVTERNVICRIREYIIKRIQERFDSNSESQMLSILLILGRADDRMPAINELAVNCGCIHVLALSGMHLNVITAMFGKIKKKKLRYFLSLAAVSVFCFAAGPRPSLVRAALMNILCFLPVEERLLVSFFIQMILFPHHMVNIGCIYAYVSVIALVMLSPYLSALFHSLIPAKPAAVIASSVSVLILNAPIQMILQNKWFPSAIIAGPVAGLFAALSMISGFILLFAGQIGFVIKANDAVYMAMYTLFERCSLIPAAGITGFAVMLCSALSLCALSLAKKKHTRRSISEKRENLKNKASVTVL